MYVAEAERRSFDCTPKLYLATVGAGGGADGGVDGGGQDTRLVRVGFASYLMSAFCFSRVEMVVLNFRSGELENGLGLNQQLVILN